jgi:hypothetical protein
MCMKETDIAYLEQTNWSDVYAQYWKNKFYQIQGCYNIS